MKAVDLFCGCGGISLGFQNAGIEIVAAFDKWKEAIRVYRQNFKHPAFCVDLKKLNHEQIIQFEPEMIVGGPPCQDFSSAGKRDQSLGRADLTIRFAEIVVAVKPQWVVMENVPRIIKTEVLQSAKQILTDAGYGLSEEILNASLCGVPQDRKRYFLIGEWGGDDGALGPYLIKNLAERPMTIYDYLGESLGIEHYYRHPRSYKRRAIFSIYEPSPTIRGVNRPIPATYENHPGDTASISPRLRPLTTLERSYLQTFPPEFVFEGTKTSLETMIGNAVPVNLATYVAKAIWEYIEAKHEDKLVKPLKQLPLF